MVVQNQSIIRILTTDSRQPQLQAIALNVLQYIAMGNQIRLEPDGMRMSRQILSVE